ncbi:hypothetical protein HZS_370 [Henneguya salminicola]|nr:hypothetical protein HZS_370 [Henneguya salminicola]
MDHIQESQDIYEKKQTLFIKKGTSPLTVLIKFIYLTVVNYIIGIEVTEPRPPFFNLYLSVIILRVAIFDYIFLHFD